MAPSNIFMFSYTNTSGEGMVTGVRLLCQFNAVHDIVVYQHQPSTCTYVPYPALYQVTIYIHDYLGELTISSPVC